MDKLAAIDNAIAALEAQRAVLGDAVVDTAVQPLLEQRAGLVDVAVFEQRKLVTVLFSDLVDFTVLSQQLDAEDVRTVIDAYFMRWQEHITANGGVVEKFIGDAVMAVFGMHKAAEEDPHRAIRTALTMRSSLAELNAEVGAAYGVTLDMRVGIDTGEVVVSTLGERPGQEFVVVGDIVNRAARFQSAAPSGGILISADTFRHVRGSFAVHPMTGLQLKGIAEPVDGFLIQSERPRGFRLDDARGVEGVDTRTVGRETQLRQLQDRYYDVAEEQQWHVITVVGEAGVGKSRLLSDFSRWLDDLPEPTWLFNGRASHSGLSVPYALLHDLFATRFDVHDSDDPSEVRRKWERGLKQALDDDPDAVDKAHAIGLWLGFEIGDSRVLEGARDDPRNLSERATSHLVEYFRRLVERAPVVLLLEDLHWADEAMLSLINAADAVLRESRVLVVATTRPTLLERHPHWGEGLDFHTRMALDSLSRRETRQLLTEIMKRAEHVPQALSDLVVTASEGNPFYVEELVKWLLEAGVITKDDGAWRVFEERLEQAKVPATLRSVLQARLDWLTPAERRALQRAAVIGRVFWDDAVESLRVGGDRPRAEGDPPATESLDRLREREVVYQREQSVFEHTREFLFKHALLRDVAYDGVLRRHRQTYHGLAARWFEQMAERTRRADEYAGLIADHYANAGNGEAAARWYLAAGQQAASVNGLTDATRLLGRGLGLAPASATVVRFDLLLARESVLDRIGDRPGQQADLDALAALESEVDDPARRIRLLLTRCRWLFHHSEYAAQYAAAQEAIDLASGTGPTELEPEARLWMGKGLAWEGKHQAARESLDRALAGARTLGLRAVVTEALRYLAIVANNVSEFPQAESLLHEAIELHREVGDTEGETVALVQLTSVYFNAGRLAEARSSLESALPIVVASGYRYREAVVVSNLAAIVLDHGELGRSRRLITRGLELCLELDDLEGVATARNILGDVLRRSGDLEAAEAELRVAFETVTPIGFDLVQSDTSMGLALVATARGRHDEALSRIDDSIERARSVDSPRAVARGLVGRGYVMLASGHVAEAGQSLRDGLKEAERLGLEFLVVEANASLARVALLNGERDEASAIAGRVLENLGRRDLLGAIEPSEIYRTCWRVLADLEDPRAPAALAAARAYLDEMAGLIDDDELLASFLHRVPANVEIAEASGRSSD